MSNELPHVQPEEPIIHPSPFDLATNASFKKETREFVQQRGGAAYCLEIRDKPMRCVIAHWRFHWFGTTERPSNPTSLDHVPGRRARLIVSSEKVQRFFSRTGE